MTPPPVRTGPGHALTRVVPLVCLLALGCTVALIVSPGLRRQLQLSTTEQPQPFVDLYFANVAAARACPTVHGMARLVLKVDSHLTEGATLRYAVSVRSDTASHRVEQRRLGTVRTTPGRVSTIRATVPAPSRAYAVAVRLPGRPEHLLVHCTATRTTR